MGLLDRFDPGALSLLAAAGPTSQPMSLGQRLFGALQQTQAMKQAEEDRKLKQQMQAMQMLQLQNAMDQAKRQQAEAEAMKQKRASFLDSIDPSRGPAMPMSVPNALNAGISASELALLAPKKADSPFAKIDPLKADPASLSKFNQTGNYSDLAPRQEAPKPEKVPEPLRTLQLIYGENSPEYMQAARALAQKMTTHQPSTKVEVNTGDRIPPQLVKLQDEMLDKHLTAKAIDADLGAVQKQIESGTLKFGPIRNLANTGKNIVGASDEESRAYGSFKSTMEKLRNDSLRLNTGVQTEGDAMRAWNELFQNINDTKFVNERLKEIRQINQRGAELQKYRLNVLRSNSGAGPLDTPNVNPAVGQSGKKVVRTGRDAGGRKVVQYEDGSIGYAD